MLDCCAAPGGKTSPSPIAISMRDITAIELHPHRAVLLQRLLNLRNPTTAARSRHIRVIAADARHLPFATNSIAFSPMFRAPALARWPEIQKLNGGSYLRIWPICKRDNLRSCFRPWSKWTREAA